MRQAGRYLPEYRKTRLHAGDFLTLCRTPELACEVTLQPLRRYALDAAIIFSDILVIPDAMGLGLRMEESVGPVFERPITCAADISKLAIPDPEDDLGYVMRAVEMTVGELNNEVPLIGFAGSPWTLAAYMIEGRSKTDFSKILAFAETNTDNLHQLLDILARSVASYLKAKARSGASALMLFDTWGGLLDTQRYRDLSLRYMSQILEDLPETIPKILFTKGGGDWLELMADTQSNALGLDWNVDIGDARRRVGDRVALQGNLNPASLRLSDEEIVGQTEQILESFGPHPGHIFNLGHGITPDIDPEKVSVMVNAVRNLSRQYH